MELVSLFHSHIHRKFKKYFNKFILCMSVTIYIYRLKKKKNKLSFLMCHTKRKKKFPSHSFSFSLSPWIVQGNTAKFLALIYGANFEYLNFSSFLDHPKDFSAPHHTRNISICKRKQLYSFIPYSHHLLYKKNDAPCFWV